MTSFRSGNFVTYISPRNLTWAPWKKQKKEEFCFVFGGQAVVISFIVPCWCGGRKKERKNQEDLGR